MTSEERTKIVERHVAELSEIYDAVQILGTWLNENGETCGQKRGSGNWYARQGMAREFLEQDSAELSAKAIGERLDPPDDSLRKDS